MGSPAKDAAGKKKSPRRRSSIADRIAALNQLPGSPGAAAPRAAPSKVASPTTPEAASGAVVDGSQAKAVGSATSQAEPADAAGKAADTATPPADGQDSGATGASTPSQGEPKKKRKSKSARSSRSSAMAARLAALEAAGAPVMGMTPANRKPRTRPMSMPQSSKHHMDAERPRGGSVASLQARLSGLQFGYGCAACHRVCVPVLNSVACVAEARGRQVQAAMGLPRRPRRLVNPPQLARCVPCYSWCAFGWRCVTQLCVLCTCQLEATMARPVLRRKKKTKKKLAASALPVGLGDDLGLDFAAPEAPAATNRDSGDVPAPPSVPPQATTPAAANSDSPVEPPTAP